MFTTRIVAAGEDFFFKDNRKISVGECALFKPPQDSPPFTGIIRCLISKDKNLKLGVNWLYRPADVKLGKGIVLDAAPNEIFYSFHTDEILAASLLHPCKVAFLPKDVELPPGTSTFICQRVYDITKKCLWWLTDPDYIDERHKEVNQLLVKTQQEMHATLQSGSPKSLNGPASPSHVKASSGNVQNSALSFPSQSKRKKREHVDHGMESVKRGRSLKADDGEITQYQADSVLKSEIANITEKGGLVDLEGVEKLVKLMQPDRVQQKVDLIGRSMLVCAIAMTDKFDCLTQFLQLRGLLVLDEWLQDVHKGKIDTGKDGDKAVEEFVLVLLRALDKLPVNLQALQMCNIGRSVNHLRTNKNLEIQKKARSLVDTWKKRVEAEMNIIETKSGSSEAVSWPSKSRVPDVSHGGSRQRGGSSEVLRKSSVALVPVSKTSSPNCLVGETAIKSESSSPGSIRATSSLGAGKDGQTRISFASDLPSTPAREDKSSGSSQSHTYSQSLSGKEDARSSTAGSMSVKKVSSGTSRHRKSINGGPGLTVSGVQRETRSNKTSSLHSASNSERTSILTSEKALDVPIVEAKNQKLIVKIPSRVRSPAVSTSGGISEEAYVTNSIEPSPLPSEKQDDFDRSGKVKNDVHRVIVTSEVNTESWQSNDFKDILTGSDEGDVSPAAVNNVDQSNNVDAVQPTQVSKPMSSSPWNEPTSEKKTRCSIPFTNVPAHSSPRDNVGINLLASVAAGEMPESHTVSPTASPGNPIVPEDPTVGNKSDISLSPGNTLESGGGTENDRKLGSVNKSSLDDSFGGRKLPPAEHHEHSNFFSVDLQPTVDQRLQVSQKAGMGDSASGAVSSVCNEKVTDSEVSKHQEEIVTNLEDNQEHRVNGFLLTKDKDNVVLAGIEEGAEKIITIENESVDSEGKPSSMGMKSYNKKLADEVLHCCGSSKDIASEKRNGSDTLDNRSSTGKAGGERPVMIEGLAGSAKKSERLDVEFYSKKSQEHYSGESVSHKESSLTNEGEDAKLAFDLNEGFATEDGKSLKSCNTTVTESPAHVVSPLPFPVSSVSNCLPAPVTVAAASKGPFVSIQELMQGKGELRWKGSAATSAFCPAGPRKVLEMPLGSSCTLPGATASGSKDKRRVLDFDLNVADERVPEDMDSHDLATEASSVSGFKTKSDLSKSELVGSVRDPRLELDLNTVVEANDTGKHPSTSGRLRLDPLIQVSASPGGFHKFEFHRGFDLNDGPVLDDDTSEQLPLKQHTRFGLQTRVPVGNDKMSSAGIGNFPSWYPAGAYSTVAAPSVFHDTAINPFTIIAPQKLPGPSTVATLTPDAYHAPVLSSSPAIPYPSTSFQYPIFPFGHTIPLAPATFQSGSTPFMGASSGGRFNLGPAGATPSHIQRPYMISLPDGGANGGVESNLKWGRQGLDLNAGPGGGDAERRDEITLLASRQASAGGALALVDENSRMLHHSLGGNFKRKEPEGSWDIGRSSRHKQSPWP